MTSPDIEPDQPLSLLLVEDTDDDAALIVRALRQADFTLRIGRVQTATAFIAALAPPPDLIICDHALPSFSSTAALSCLHERDLDIPFIVVSGTIDEESAVTILKAGAHDFVTKQNLARLGPAIRRELQEARIRAERREALRQLQVQRDYLRLVIDSNPALIFAKDEDGRYTLANRATADLYGTTPDELVGKTDRQLNPDTALVSHLRESERAVITSGRSTVIARESRTDRRTGEVRWFETRKVPLIVPSGLPQVLGIGLDITERVAAEEALRVSEEQFRQAQKMEAVGQLAGGIAHDFNNLLTAILGYSDLLLEQVRMRPEIAADVEQIRKAGQRAAGLTRQLLAFSRKQVMEPRILDLNEVVSELQKMLERVIGEHIRLRTIPAAGLHLVKADRGQIEQVILNLAINARDAMPQGGTLTIQTANGLRALAGNRPEEAGDPQSCVILTVSDTGSGMPPDIQARIFEPFFTTKGPGRGTGLGLSMVYGVVTQSGGRIAVESGIGQGTTFTIILPAAAEDVLNPRPQRARAPQKLQGAETILLVEDEAGIRELVRKVLTSHGYTVLEAADGPEGFVIAERHPAPIHLLLSDIVMPGLNGPELAQRLLRLRPKLRVLYMSGFGNLLSTGVGTLSSAVRVLHKPFTPEDLVRTVRDSLNQGEASSAERAVSSR